MRELQKLSHQQSRDKGFWDVAGEVPLTTLVAKLALIHSEVSEAVEELRAGRNEVWYSTERSDTGLKPEGFPVELADIVIRVLDLAERLKIDLEPVILEKLTYNATRPYRHGKEI